MTQPADRRVADDPRAPLAAFLSFLFPGLGQAYNGERALAALLAVPVLVIVAAILGVSLAARTGVIARLLDARFLIGLIVLDLALLGWRLVAIAQAHRRRRPFSTRRWTTWATAVVLLLTLVMHAVPAWYATLAIDTLSTVAADTADPATGDSGAREGFDPLPPPSEQPEVTRGERVNILLVGVDFAPGRTTDLTDTMLIVSLDPDTGRTSMLSVPRDLYGAPLPDGREWDAKLNSLMASASNNPAEFPLGGPGTLKATISELLDVPIHYFAAINIIGFKQAIDVIGGVDVTNPRLINDPLYFNEFGEHTGFYLEPGTYHMDGATAVAYARTRQGIGDNDFTRADRQQQILAAVRDKLTAGNLILALPGLLDAVKNTIATDLPESRLPELAAALQEADTDALERAVIQPPLVTPATASDGAYILIPDIEGIRELAADLLGDGDTTASRH
jgi:LCP family protein required for cell wall assembly